MPKILCLLLASLLVSVPCFAQQTFKLNVKMSDEGPFCFTREAAIDIANGGNPKASDVILDAHIREGSCVIMEVATITYIRKVYQYEKFRVYEGIVGNITFFNPTRDIAVNEEDI